MYIPSCVNVSVKQKMRRKFMSYINQSTQNCLLYIMVFTVVHKIKTSEFT